MNRRLLSLIALVVIVFIILVVALQFYNNIPTRNLTKYDNVLVPSSLLSSLQISNNVSNQVGIGSVTSPFISVSAKPLYNGTKPVIIYVGAEYCPYCAAERWAILVALLRFGSFSGVRYMTSSTTDIFPDTPTFTFHNATYSSSYIIFSSVEIETNTGAPLASPSVLQNTTFNDFDLNNAKLTPSQRGGIPFMDFANHSVLVGATFLPEDVSNPSASPIYGMNWTQIASQLNNPSSPSAQAIIGTANLFTAEICKLTNESPSSVCSQPYVSRLQSIIGSSS